MALENQRYGRNKETLVNKTYIESGEYRRKFDRATDRPAVNRTLYECAKAALKHRSGTVLEDMYWIDGDIGAVVAKELDGTDPKKIRYSTATQNCVDSYPQGVLIALHTHPSSMPPSDADFSSCYRNGYRMGFVACHDGKLFAYTANETVSESLYLMYIQRHLNAHRTQYEAQLLALEDLKKSHRIDFWEVI